MCQSCIKKVSLRRLLKISSIANFVDERPAELTKIYPALFGDLVGEKFLWICKNSIMTEDQIRSDIRSQLPRIFRKNSEARLVEEMEICAGKARADMAVISDRLIGIEIKGPRDNLDRLPSQVDQYSKCFDQVVLVVHELLANAAVQLIPQWWGVVVGSDKNGTNTYQLRRRPNQNRGVDVDAVLTLLWRQEIEALYIQFLDLPPSIRSSKRKLRTQLLADISPTALKVAGIRQLRQRQEWRSEPIG